MITLYKDYLEQKLKDIGLNGKIYKTLKELKQYSGAELGGILTGEENFARNGTRSYVEKDGIRYIRKKVYDRSTNIVVVLSGKDDAATDELMVQFIALLDKGIDDTKGNWVEIECLKGDWVEDMDSVLRNKIAVQLLVTFKGGIYVDKATIPIKNIELTTSPIT